MRLEYFQMIDAVTAFDVTAQTLSAQSVVPMESPIFEGHFPGHPLMPGVLLIETMAQASGYLLLGLNGIKKMPFLAGVERAKLRRFVEPGKPLEVQASLVHEGSGYAVTRAKIISDGSAVCDAELMFRIMPFPDEMQAGMRAQARRIGLLADAI